MNGSNGNLFRAIRGPIVLITLGSLLAVDHFGPYGFSRTWPVLIIIMGLLKLLESIVGRAPRIPSGPGGATGPGMTGGSAS